jgi:hypothetical protein
MKKGAAAAAAVASGKKASASLKSPPPVTLVLNTVPPSPQDSTPTPASAVLPTAKKARTFDFKLPADNDRTKTLYSGGLKRNKECRLKFVTIPGPTTTDGWIVFRLEPKVHGSGCFLEKKVLDAVSSDTPPSWVTDFGFKRFSLQWYDGNILMTNSGGFAVRLFYAQYERLPSKEDQVGMMEVICEYFMEQIKADTATRPDGTKLADGTTLELDPNNMTWLSVDRVVWNDIIGEEATKRALSKLLGPPQDHKYFNRYRSIIECYFRPGSMTESVVRWLKVPPDSMAALMGAHELRTDAELLGSDEENDQP